MIKSNLNISKNKSPAWDSYAQKQVNIEKYLTTLNFIGENRCKK